MRFVYEYSIKPILTLHGYLRNPGSTIGKGRSSGFSLSKGVGET